YFTGPASSLIGMNRTVQDALIAADRLFEIMDLQREESGQKATLSREMIGDICFNDVTFRYGSRVTVFEQLNLCIQKGKVTAIVGESGSGKTTLLSLLQGLYPLRSGNITIGGFDIKYLSNESLRRLVGVVPQRIDLFAGNILENIAAGEFEPDLKKVMRICSNLGMNEFIEKLPNGFHTCIGENGAALSGGQRQRLAIARALYREPEILILDEATSSLDPSLEAYIMEAVFSMRDQGKTILLITHRLSTALHSDRILVLNKGLVLEEGSHAALMQGKGRYYAMWLRQLPLSGKNPFQV
ncbi:MAG TPA: ATP-binding cassette domain-containing protein, partial [Anseongella sp.]|nr:ATP-binding cassette domain-containing protein [Anseongella sp.]